LDKITGSGHGHVPYRCFTHRVGKPIWKTQHSRNGGDIQNHTSTTRFHDWDDRLQTIVDTLDIYTENPIKIPFSRVFRGADIRDSGIVDQNLNTFFELSNLSNRFGDLGLVSHITQMGEGDAFPLLNLTDNAVSSVSINVKEMETSSPFRKLESDRPSYSFTASSDNCDLTIQAQIILLSRLLFIGTSRRIKLSNTLKG
jgi:hypothetical protein